MKAKLLIETVVAGETISKEKLTSEEIKVLGSKNRIDSKPIQRNACYFNRR
jgi:hypothetical protein